MLQADQMVLITSPIATLWLFCRGVTEYFARSPREPLLPLQTMAAERRRIFRSHASRQGDQATLFPTSD